MSLYADEDIGSGFGGLDVQAGVAGPSSASYAAAAAVPTDPGQALAAALILPAETPAQADALVAASRRFEEHPERLPEILAKVLPMVVDGGESLLRSWAVDMVALAVGRSALKGEVKMHVALTSLDALVRLLHTTSAPTVKAVIPIFSTLYPLLFRHLATTRGPSEIYNHFINAKARILSLLFDSSAQPQNVGVKAAAWKYVQRILLAGTRAAAVDPRLQGKLPVDPSISMIVQGSMLSVPELEQETVKLQTQLVTELYTSRSDPAILHPILQTLPLLAKSRPALAPLCVSSLTSWTPQALEAARRPAMQIRAVERTAKSVMQHILKLSTMRSFAVQLNEALVQQKQRMETAFAGEQAERRARRQAPPPADPVLGKHPNEAESSAQAAKRARLGVQIGRLGGQGPLVDVSTFAVDGVIEAVMEALEIIPLEAIQAAFENARRALQEGLPDAMDVLAVPLGLAEQGAKDEVKDQVDDEVLNPLDMDMEDDDLLQPLEDEELDEPMLMSADFVLPPPEPLDPAESGELADAMAERIYTARGDLDTLADIERDGKIAAIQPKEMWMLLLARMATMTPETKRQVVAGFVSSDFTARSKFAALWLNEEWLAGKTGATSQYAPNLESILAAYLPKIDVKDKSLASFLALLPELPPFVLTMLEKLCEDADRSIVGLLALRDLVDSRPPVREEALRTLLQLCTHPERRTRVLAIRTVCRWVPSSPMSRSIVNYALAIMRRLAKKSGEPAEGEDADMEDGEEADEVAETKHLHDDITPENIPQHVELTFALSRRQPDLLDDIFHLYARMDESTQQAVEDLLEPLIQSLGPSAKLLEILRSFPTGTDKLVLRTVLTLSKEGSSPALVDLIKGLMGERELDPRFIVSIIGELDKTEIERQIPRVVSLLGTSDTARDMVRTAFASVLQKITPADLLVALHTEETGLKPTIEAIGICFSMTTVFRSDVLASAMSRIADLPTLPVVFLRTIIQAVTTYKSLVPFVANNILPKLVAKKIWETPQLWDGFVRLAKLIAPASFGALLQLPKEWLKDVVEKQPTLKTGLKTFLASKPQAKGALAEIFGDDQAQS